jgi:uracil-DNA glycosylase family 4
MKKEAKEVISDFKTYFEYLKEMGIASLPFSDEAHSQKEVFLSVTSSLSLTLARVREELGDCKRCKLHRTRKTIVFGEGHEKARLMVIGEGPGFEEDVQGRPFVGRAAQLLTKILQSIQLQREEVYITNIVKCRPPQNRNPEPDEIESCNPFLSKQIQAIQPRIICTLGTFASQTVLKTDAKITALRGRFYDRDGVKIFPTYHPAYLLRNPERKRDVWEDMKQIQTWLSQIE